MDCIFEGGCLDDRRCGRLARCAWNETDSITKKRRGLVTDEMYLAGVNAYNQCRDKSYDVTALVTDIYLAMESVQSNQPTQSMKKIKAI